MRRCLEATSRGSTDPSLPLPSTAMPLERHVHWEAAVRDPTSFGECTRPLFPSPGHRDPFGNSQDYFHTVFMLWVTEVLSGSQASAASVRVLMGSASGRLETQSLEMQQSPRIPGFIPELCASPPLWISLPSLLSLFSLHFPVLLPHTLLWAPISLQALPFSIPLFLVCFSWVASIHSVFHFPIPGAQLGLGQVPSLGLGGWSGRGRH